MAHPQGMTGLHLRPNTLAGQPVMILVDYGDAGTITSPIIVKTMNMEAAREFVRRMNAAMNVTESLTE